MSEMMDLLARRRVRLGFAIGVIAIILARPTWDAWRAGFAVAVLGELFRIWAAGHLEKSRDVTRSGPYRLTRHPLYLGSIVMAAGVVIACRSVGVAILTAIYLGTTIPAAIRSEEVLLTRQFGDTYERYRESRADPMPRRFSLARVRRNREYRAVIGLFLGFGLLALELMFRS